jgi:hypothetical protein
MAIFDPIKNFIYDPISPPQFPRGKVMHCIACSQEDTCTAAGICYKFGGGLNLPPHLPRVSESTSPQKPKTIEPGSDSWWLYEYQKLMTNVLGWVETGKSETAIRVMQEMQSRWQNHCKKESS